MHQFISKDCTHISEREEPFYMLSVTVKNKSTIQQALEAYITVMIPPSFASWVQLNGDDNRVIY